MVATLGKWIIPPPATPADDTPDAARKILLDRVVEGVRAAETEPIVPGKTRMHPIPWYRGTEWHDFAAAYKVGSRKIELFELNCEISAETGYGCIDLDKGGCAVQILTDDEQRKEATAMIVRFVRDGILHIKDGDWDEYPGLTGTANLRGPYIYDKKNLGDIARLQRNFPRGCPLVNDSEVIANVLADKDVGPDWVINPTNNYAAKPR